MADLYEDPDWWKGANTATKENPSILENKRDMINIVHKLKFYINNWNQLEWKSKDGRAKVIIKPEDSQVIFETHFENTFSRISIKEKFFRIAMKGLREMITAKNMKSNLQIIKQFAEEEAAELAAEELDLKRDKRRELVSLYHSKN